jgi:hypothetical protein
VEQINNTDKRGFCPDGHLYRHRHSFQAVSYHPNATPEVGSRSIHFVNETDTRNAKAIRLPPDRLGLGLHSMYGVKDHYPTIKDAQTALHLGGEVNMAWRINDVNAMVPPEASDGRRYYGNAALSLLIHPIGNSRPLIHIAQTMGSTCVKEETLCRGGFARVNMGNNPDVPSPL